jgi:type I restriction enzyme M protein
LHDVDIPNQIVNKDTLKTSYLQYERKDKVDVIIANPPFGGTMSDGDENNFPQEFRTRETAVLFTYLFFHLLKPTGRAGVVLPDGFLFGDDNASVAIRKKILEECNLHTIVRLPRGVFTAGVMTNLLFFEKGQKTDNVWYYQLPLPKDLLNGYTKKKPVTDKEFDVVREWWNDRKENENAWKVSIEDIKSKNWNLDSKNPHQKEIEKELSSRELVESILEREDKIKGILKSI